MFQKCESAHKQINEEEQGASVLTPDEIHRKLLAALECKEPVPPAGWCPSQLDDEIREAGRKYELNAKIRQADALQTCLFYLAYFARRMPEWINTTAGNDRVKLLCLELSDEIEKITWHPAEVIERGGKLKASLNAILAVQTCLIYREETARNIDQATEAKRAAKFQRAKDNPFPQTPAKEKDWYTAAAKNIFEKVCGKSSVKPSEKSPESEAQPNLF